MIEGIRDDLWNPQTPYDPGSEVFAAYDASRERAAQMDYFGRIQRRNRPGLGIGLDDRALRLELAFPLREGPWGDRDPSLWLRLNPAF